jgi:hypothetical protein
MNSASGPPGGTGGTVWCRQAGRRAPACSPRWPVILSSRDSAASTARSTTLLSPGRSVNRRATSRAACSSGDSRSSQVITSTLCTRAQELPNEEGSGSLPTAPASQDQRLWQVSEDLGYRLVGYVPAIRASRELGKRDSERRPRPLPCRGRSALPSCVVWWRDAVRSLATARLNAATCANRDQADLFRARCMRSRHPARRGTCR